MCRYARLWLDTKAFSAGENAGAAAAGRPACAFQVTDEPRRIPPSVLTPPAGPPPLKNLTAVFHITLAVIIRAFGRVRDRLAGGLTATAGAKKHGCSAESPNAARRASVQSAPLEACRNSRGSSAATGTTSGRENARNGAFRLYMSKKATFFTLACREKVSLCRICQSIKLAQVTLRRLS